MRGVQPTPFLTAGSLGKGLTVTVSGSLWLAPCSPRDKELVCVASRVRVLLLALCVQCS